jgi:hypothetical protein
LDLAGGAGGFVDDAETAAADDVVGQAKVDDVEEVEEFGAKLEDAELVFAAMAEGSVFDQAKVEIVKGRDREKCRGPRCSRYASGSDIARLLRDRQGVAHQREEELTAFLGHRYVARMLEPHKVFIRCFQRIKPGRRDL